MQYFSHKKESIEFLFLIILVLIHIFRGYKKQLVLVKFFVS